MGHGGHAGSTCNAPEPMDLGYRKSAVDPRSHLLSALYQDQNGDDILHTTGSYHQNPSADLYFASCASSTVWKGRVVSINSLTSSCVRPQGYLELIPELHTLRLRTNTYAMKWEECHKHTASSIKSRIVLLAKRYYFLN